MTDVAKLGLEADSGPIVTASKDLRGLTASARNAENQSRRLTTSNRQLSQSLRNTAGSLAVIHGPLGGVAGRFSSLSTLMGRTGLLLGTTALGFGALSLAASRSVRAFQQFETQQLVTQQVLQATGNSAGRTIEQIEALAQGIAASTLASTRGVRAAATQLLTFRTISGETFDRTLRLAQDLSAVGFGSLESSAVQLAKALEDPANGLTMLRRVGVSFTADQQRVIKSLHETGQTADAQRMILAQVERQVGGAGSAAAGGLSGAFDTLSQASTNLAENFGRVVAEGSSLRSVILGIASAIRAIDESAFPTLDSQVLNVQQRLQRLRDQMADQGVTITFDTDLQDIGKMMPDLGKLLEGDPRGLGIFQASEGVLTTRNELEAEYNELLQEQARIARDREQAAVMSDINRRQEQRDRVAGIITELEEEREAARQTEIQKRILEEQRKLGAGATDEEREQVAQLVRQIYAEEEAREASKASLEDRKRSLDRLAEATHAARTELQILKEHSGDEIQQQVNLDLYNLGFDDADFIYQNIDAVREYRDAHTELLEERKRIADFQSWDAEAETIINRTRSALERHNAEVERYKELAEAGHLTTEELNRAIEHSKKRFEEATDSTFDFNDAIKSSMSGMASELRRGTDAVEVLTQAFDRLIDRVMDFALDQLFNQLNSSGGGGIASWFGFSSGGYTGNKGRNQVAGVVHGQEYVVNAAATQKHRPLLEHINSGGGLPGTNVAVAYQPPSIIINNKTGESVQARTQQRGDGGFDIELELDKATARNLRRSGSQSNKALREGFGARPQLAQR